MTEWGWFTFGAVTALAGLVHYVWLSYFAELAEAEERRAEYRAWRDARREEIAQRHEARYLDRRSPPLT